MPRLIELDNKIHSFPDDATDKDVEIALRNYSLGLIGPRKGPEPSAVADSAKNVGGSFVTGVGRGVASLVGLPRALSQGYDAARWWLGDQVSPYLPEGAREAYRATSDLARDQEGLSRFLPATEDAKQAIEGVIPPTEPQSAPARIARDVGQLAGSFPARAGLVPALVGGAAAEPARQAARTLGATPAQQEKVGDIAMLVAPLGVAGVQGLRSTPAEMIARRTATLTPGQWEAGAARQQAAQASGVPIMGPEALDSPALAKLASDARATATGAPAMEGFLAQRPAQVAAAAEGAASSIGPRQDPTEVLARVQRAAEAVLERAQQQLSSAAGPHYTAARATPIPQPDIDYLTTLLTDASRNTAEGTARELLGLAAKIRQNPTIGSVSAEIKDLAERSQRAGTIAAAETDLAAKRAAALGAPAIRQTEGVMEAVSPQYAQGQNVYRQGGPAVEALRGGPMGRLATKTPDDIPNPEGAVVRQTKIIADPTVATPASIRTIARSLTREDPVAFRDWAAEYLRATFNRAARDLQAGENQMAGANWREAIYGTPRDRENLRAVFEEAAHAAGQPTSGVLAGFERLMDTLSRTGRVPGMGSPTATRGASMAEASEGSLAVASLNLQLSDPLKPIRRWVQDRFQRAQFEELGRIFTRPDSVAYMRQIAMTGPGTAREAAILSMLQNSILEQSQQEQQRGQ